MTVLALYWINSSDQFHTYTTIMMIIVIINCDFSFVVTTCFYKEGKWLILSNIETDLVSKTTVFPIFYLFRCTPLLIRRILLLETVVLSVP